MGLREVFNLSDRTKIIIVRHGESVGNLEQRVRGRADFPLNENGLAQARATGEALKGENIECVYSSPLSRAMVTAKAIAETGGFRLRTEERFNNMTYGSWEGRTKYELEHEFPEQWKIWIAHPEDLRIDGAETFDDARDRAVEALGELTERHAGKTFAIVSHRGLIKPMISGVLGMAKPYFWKLYIDNSSISTLTHSASMGYTLTELNRTCHLEGLARVEELT